MVYKYNPAAKVYTQLKTVTSSSYTNTGLVKGTDCSFKVKAYKTVHGVNIYGNATGAKIY